MAGPASLAGSGPRRRPGLVVRRPLEGDGSPPSTAAGKTLLRRKRMPRRAVVCFDHPRTNSSMQFERYGPGHVGHEREDYDPSIGALSASQAYVHALMARLAGK